MTQPSNKENAPEVLQDSEGENSTKPSRKERNSTMSTTSIADAAAEFGITIEPSEDGDIVPAPDADYEEVHACSCTVQGSDGIWHVHIDTDIDWVDAPETRALAAAFTRAAREATILNMLAAGRRVIEGRYDYSKVPIKTGDVVPVVEEKRPYAHVTIGHTGAFFPGRRPGERWIDDDFEYEHLGLFEVVDYEEQSPHIIVAEVL